MIHVVIPVYKRINLTINCINSLLKQKNYELLNIVIVDDDTSNITKSLIEKINPKIKILKGTGSLFWGGSISLGINYVLNVCSPRDWILILNNDVQLVSNSIEKLLITAQKNKRKSIVGALIVNVNDKKTIIKSGTIVKSWFLNYTNHIFKGLKLDDIIKKTPVEVDFLTGRCVLHPVELFLKAGNYDSYNFPHYGADDEFTHRVKKFGYISLLDPSSVAYLVDTNKKKLPKNFLKKFYFILFSKKSSSNIINKFHLTMKVVPNYAKLTFMVIGLLKSILICFIK